MKYYVFYNVDELIYTLEKRINTLNAENPYTNKAGAIILLKCKNVEERNKILTKAIRAGYDLKGISSKNALWIKVADNYVYLETTNSLFKECKNPKYDEIYVHKTTDVSDKFMDMLKSNNVRYKALHTFHFFEEHLERKNKLNKTGNKGNKDNKDIKDKEKSKKVIPEALKGLELNDDLHGFEYRFGTDMDKGFIKFHSSEKIDQDKLEELIRKYFG